MSSVRLSRPIILIGAARSGTTMLARTLAKHPDVAVWMEPKMVWRYGHAYRRNDVLLPADASPRVKAYIHREFAEYLEQSGRKRFAEKTPSNCMRVGFILEVFPDAQIIHLLRDGRDVAISAMHFAQSTGRKQRLQRRQNDPSLPAPRKTSVWYKLARTARRLHIADWTSLIETPAYAPTVARMLFRNVLHRSVGVWGPHVPGLRDIRRSYPLLEACALQWDISVRLARSACSHLPSDQYLELRYEDICSEARRHMSMMLCFLNLPIESDIFDAMTAGVRPYRGPNWPRDLKAQQVKDIEMLVGSTLRELGYDLSAY